MSNIIKFTFSIFGLYTSRSKMLPSIPRIFNGGSMKRLMCRTLLVVVIFALVAATGFAADAKWPSGPVTIVCSSRAGGFADIHSRILADYLQRKTGVPFAVLNITDGGGTVGAETVRKAKPDGLRLFYMHTSFPISCYTGVYKVDPDKDFTNISSVANGGNNAYVVRADSKWNNLNDLMEYAKKNPQKVLWGAQLGGTTQIMMALFERAGNVKFKMVDAGTEAEKITALLGGFIDVANVGMSNADQYVKAKKMKVLAITGDSRDFAYPDYPTAVEQGYDVVWNAEFALYGPPGMPDALVNQINEALDGFGTKDQASKDALTKQGSFVTPRTTAESIAFMHATHKMLKEICIELGF
jgi:tripartite-type tricarboxylate transporter receptor subunit TctC